LYAPQTSLGGIEKYPDLATKAAALLYALAKSQACADGNKRLALILLLEFLALNGATLNIGSDDLTDMILDTAAADAARRDDVVAQLGDTLAQMIVPLTMEE
jgi:death on curing protein